jgi:hypothetical protein
VPHAERSLWQLPAPLRRRGLLLFVGSTLYAAVAAVRSNADSPRRAWIAGILALAFAWLATRPAPSGPEAERDARADPLGEVSYATWGLALAVVSLAAVSPAEGGPPTRGAWIHALGTIGACIAATAACSAYRGVARPLGIAASLPPPREATRIAGVLLGAASAVVVVLATVSEGFSTAVFGGPLGAGDLEAGFGVLELSVLALLFGDRLRAERLVLGAAERARAAVGSVLGIAGIAVAVIVVRAGEPASVLVIAASSAGIVACVCASFKDPIRLAKMGRRALALGLFGGPVVLLSVIASEGITGTSATAALLGGLAALGIGTLGTWLEKPLRPAEGRWLDAIDAAHKELARSDPETSAQGALRALRAAGGASAESPELWFLDPTHVLTIDAAGYAREREASLPTQLLEVAAAEPESTVRTELLDALLVRRPDLRALARWMDERGALAATLVMREGEVGGVLVVPRGAGREPVTLEEAHALEELAGAMAGACTAKSAFARSLSREREATIRAEAAELDLDRHRHAEALASGRLALEVAREMRGAEVGRYSPAVRFAHAAIERRMRVRAPLVVVGPAGLDPVPDLAAAHVRSARRPETPFVVIDGTASPEHDVARWRDPVTSPLALAQGGLLVLVDGAALPVSVQRLVAQALAERRTPWEQGQPLDVVIALTSTRPLAELTRTCALDPAFAARLGDASEAEIVLPRLEGRPEDLRALLGDRLAREGLRQRGTPVGIEDSAFARLADYPFPGDYAELVLVARRLVASVSGDVVRVADVEALGLTLPDAPRVNTRASQSVS